ncbi:hypothetical protein, partial [Burkholderia contaminans]|uniref:hypothetical protein n=1 Tax=Burkholderia contaminans TaxID=488447 RepID=UPI002D7F02BC
MIEILIVDVGDPTATTGSSAQDLNHFAYSPSLFSRAQFRGSSSICWSSAALACASFGTRS